MAGCLEARRQICTCQIAGDGMFTAISKKVAGLSNICAGVASILIRAVEVMASRGEF
jgi:hypothetical protein